MASLTARPGLMTTAERGTRQCGSCNARLHSSLVRYGWGSKFTKTSLFPFLYTFVFSSSLYCSSSSHNTVLSNLLAMYMQSIVAATALFQTAIAASGSFSVLSFNVAGLPAFLQSNGVPGDKTTNTKTM